MRPEGPLELDAGYVRAAVEFALLEDAPHGDITSLACVDAGAVVDGRIIAKAAGVIAGLDFAREAFRQCAVECQPRLADGARVERRDLILTLDDAPARGVLRAERVALNFLQHLSGVATAAAKFVAAVEGTGAVILDTRKTTPGLRLAEKAAVRSGGAQNHRQGLSDGVLIKENHIRAAGGIAAAVKRALDARPDDAFLECEVTNLQELAEAMDAGARMTLLDNMDLDTMRRAVEMARERGVRTEASGNVTLETVRAVAQTGVDFISTGWITHSAPALDLSLLLDHKSG
jgi:nicotinate-nucleotide pyrophosphorylase (carboxylating)